jgi:hypothetical protein
MRIDSIYLLPSMNESWQNGAWTYAIGPHFRTQQCWLPCFLRAASRLKRRSTPLWVLCVPEYHGFGQNQTNAARRTTSINDVTARSGNKASEQL